MNQKSEQILLSITRPRLGHNTRFVNANFTKLAEGILKSNQDQEARFTDSLSQKLPEKSETTSACARVLDLLSLSSQKFHGRRRTSEKRREERERWSKMPLARPCMEHEQSTRKEGRWGKKHLLLLLLPPSKQRHQREEDRQTVAVLLLLLPPFDGRKTRARRPRREGKVHAGRKIR